MLVLAIDAHMSLRLCVVQQHFHAEIFEYRCASTLPLRTLRISSSMFRYTPSLKYVTMFFVHACLNKKKKRYLPLYPAGLLYHPTALIHGMSKFGLSCHAFINH